MNAEHTPGPWRIQEGHSKSNITAAGVPLLAEVPMTFVSVNQWKANTRLMAAAPELLDALKATMLALDSVIGASDDGEQLWDAYSGDYEAARAAIAKAEGK